LLIGGSGFVSGTLAREAMETGWEVWAVSRGKRPVAAGVHALVADREDVAEMSRVIGGAGVRFDLAVDCIAMEPAHARADLEILRGRAAQLVLISTDFVYDPVGRQFPHPESATRYVTADNYRGNKRRCELVLGESDGSLPWTVFRPSHIYGPGSELGCLPPDNRDEQLIEKILAGKTLPLVAANALQQPVFALDLARLILSVKDNLNAHNRIFNAAGPDVVEARRYYEIIAESLGVPLRTSEVPVGEFVAANPSTAAFVCHRVYDMSSARIAGLRLPSTPIEVGLRAHVASLRGRARGG
jgi:nucleoside-diphosphate-sugar epimerase